MSLIKQNKYIKYPIAIIVIFILHFTKILYPIEQALIFISSPIITAFNDLSVTTERFLNNFSANKKYQNEIKILSLQNSLLVQENAQLKYLKKENELLRKQLSFKDVSKNKLILSQILSRSTKKNYLTINKGLSSGLSEGMPVITAEGYLIGKITKTEPNISHVCLIYNKNCEFASTNLSSLDTSGVITGELGTIVRMNFIPHNQKIKLTDTIITSGLEELTPYGLSIGKVIQVNEESNNIWKNVVIEPFFDIEKVNIISVVLGR